MTARIPIYKDTPLNILKDVSPGDTLGSDIVLGVVNGSAAPSGVVGEIQRAITPVTTIIGIANATPTNTVALSLPPGDWDVQGWGCFNTSGGFSCTGTGVWLSTVPSSVPGAPAEAFTFGLTSITAGATNNSFATGTMSLSISSTQTVYLIQFISGLSGTANGYGLIKARRMR